MSSKKYAPALWIECRGNALLKGLYLGLVILSLFSLLLLPWSGWSQLFIGLLLLGLFWHTWRKRCDLSGPPLHLHWDEDGQWWGNQAGKRQWLQLDTESLVTPMLLLLRLRDAAGGRHAVVLTPRAIGADNYRKLVIRLRQR